MTNGAVAAQGTLLQALPLQNLLIDPFNPRHVAQHSQREAISTIAHDQGEKLLNLAEDIVDKGLNPAELPIVMVADEPGSYYVLEGNRRIAALKLLASSSLLTSIDLPKALHKKFMELIQRAGGNLPTVITCAVLNREDATHWIHLKHTGENAGVGIVPWDGRARQRFRGSSPALQAIEMIEQSDLIDDETKKKLPKISITNVERILGTPDARKELGVDVKNNQLILLGPEPDSKGRLAIVIDDIANKRVKVTDLDSRDQRVAYAKQVASSPLPKPVADRTKKGSGGGATGATRRTAGKVPIDRKALIPRSLKLTIKHVRINRIYDELQRLSVEEFVNACSVLFRVFIELSIDHFAKAKKLTLKVATKPKAGVSSPAMRDMTLREKIKTTYDFMESNNIADKHELKGIKSLYANKEHVLSVDSLNAYVHNMNFSPTATDLKTSWDNIQIFVEKLWDV